MSTIKCVCETYVKLIAVCKVYTSLGYKEVLVQRQQWNIQHHRIHQKLNTSTHNEKHLCKIHLFHNIIVTTLMHLNLMSVYNVHCQFHIKNYLLYPWQDHVYIFFPFHEGECSWNGLQIFFKLCYIIRAPVFGTFNNAINNFQTPVNIIVTIN